MASYIRFWKQTLNICWLSMIQWTNLLSDLHTYIGRLWCLQKPMLECFIDRSYFSLFDCRLKLFLEQFAIRSCILNSELPAKIRCHAVTQFNRNFYDIIIASDERALDQPAHKSAKLRSVKVKSDKESGVARGIDFQCVSNVINFDFPLDVSSYVHRAGRTARGNNTVSHHLESRRNRSHSNIYIYLHI